MADEKILEVKELSVSFPVKKGTFGGITGYIKAVEDVSFNVGRGETLGLVGESGCGKTTLLRALCRMLPPSNGTVNFYDSDGVYDITSVSAKLMRYIHLRIRMIFQDPDSSLNPTMTVRNIVSEPLRINKVCKSKDRLDERVVELIERVGLNKEQLDRYINTFSGGQKQRIGIARALALHPVLLLADEPTSALDVSVQAQVINLLLDIKRDLGLSMILVSHDLSIVEHVSDRIAVMYLGQFMELGSREQIFSEPLHPYTEILFGSIPQPDPNHKMEYSRLKDDIPSITNKPGGCPFHTRCPYVQDVCRTEKPEFRDISGNGHYTACHFAGQLSFSGNINSIRSLEEKR